MALNFPVNPAGGDVFGNFTYDATFKVWRSTPDVASGLPAGSIMAWGSDTAPSSWLICDGSAVSRTTYSSLFNAIGVAHGVGDGSTTFNLPNLKGRVPVGKDSTQGEFDLMGEQGGTKDIQTYGSGTATGYGLTYSGSMASASTPASNMPPYTVVNYIIKTSAGVTAGDSQLVTRFNAVEASVLTKVNLTGGNTVTGTQILVPTTAAGVPLIAKGAASQTADVQQWQDSTGTAVAKMDVSGRLSLPNIPAFSVYASAASIGSTQTMPYNTAAVNTGGHFNTSTYRFTAPVAGKYYLSIYDIGNTSVTTRFKLFKNSTDLLSIGKIHQLRGPSGADYASATSTWIVDAAVGDYFYVQVYAGTSYGTAEYSWFNGFMIG